MGLAHWRRLGVPHRDSVVWPRNSCNQIRSLTVHAWAALCHCDLGSFGMRRCSSSGQGSDSDLCNQSMFIVLFLNIINCPSEVFGYFLFKLVIISFIRKFSPSFFFYHRLLLFNPVWLFIASIINLSQSPFFCCVRCCRIAKNVAESLPGLHWTSSLTDALHPGPSSMSVVSQDDFIRPIGKKTLRTAHTAEVCW